MTNVDSDLGPTSREGWKDSFMRANTKEGLWWGALGMNQQVAFTEPGMEDRVTKDKVHKYGRYQNTMHPKDDWAKMKPAGG